MLLNVSAHLLDRYCVLWGTGRDRHRPTPRREVTDTFPRRQSLRGDQAEVPRIRGGSQGRQPEEKTRETGFKAPDTPWNHVGSFLKRRVPTPRKTGLGAGPGP